MVRYLSLSAELMLPLKRAWCIIIMIPLQQVNTSHPEDFLTLEQKSHIGDFFHKCEIKWVNALFLKYFVLFSLFLGVLSLSGAAFWGSEAAWCGDRVRRTPARAQRQQQQALCFPGRGRVRQPRSSCSPLLRLHSYAVCGACCNSFFFFINSNFICLLNMSTI